MPGVDADVSASDGARPEADEASHTDGTAGDEPDLEEPRLKYQRLGGDVAPILAGRVASAFVVSDKLLALGTSAGTVHVLDYDGNQASWVGLAFPRACL